MSFTTDIVNTQTRQFTTCPILYSPKSSLSKVWIRSRNTFRLSFELSSSDLTLASVESFATDDNDEERGVRFAPSSTTSIITGMCLEDYTAKEIDACWYSREDIRHMRKEDSQKKNRCRREHHDFNMDCGRWKA